MNIVGIFNASEKIFSVDYILPPLTPAIYNISRVHAKGRITLLSLDANNCSCHASCSHYATIEARSVLVTNYLQCLSMRNHHSTVLDNKLIMWQAQYLWSCLSLLFRNIFHSEALQIECATL
jgi:hypothetical protein